MTLLHQAEAIVTASQAKAFALAADIEAYPSFLPMCRATRIAERTLDDLLVDNLFGLGPLSVQFRTNAHLTAPAHLLITSQDEPFDDLQIEWRFEAVSTHETQVSFRFEAKLRTGLHERLMRAASGRLARTVMRSFTAELSKRTEPS